MCDAPSFLQKPMRRTCGRLSEIKIILGADQKWSLSKFPTHCAGLAYITSMAAIKSMLNVVHLQKFFWIDDVFITGVLTNASNVTVKNFQGITQGRKTPARTSNKETFFSLNKEHIIYWFFTYNYKVL
ncbi:hypothetical protein Y032_0004g1707 [Ancylostoma ceylanicum]|uniref:Hexosyltransferase n=1 Tax=Ancylostoma ceylanicum TaxID=53326 RepID=A0A016VUG1_9BILA|nr:hypothetical protein Y032_0004g1707 [Ancylostoma ceylanicum]